MIAMIALSAAFTLTGAPFDGPIAGLRVGYDEKGKLSAFLSQEQLKNGKLDLVVAGTEKGVTMVEAGANEVSEDEITEAITFAHSAMQPAIALQKQLADKVGVTAQEYTLNLPDEEIQKEVNKFLEGKMGDNLRKPYPERNDLVANLKKATFDHFKEKLGDELTARNHFTTKPLL